MFPEWTASALHSSPLLALQAEGKASHSSKQPGSRLLSWLTILNGAGGGDGLRDRSAAQSARTKATVNYQGEHRYVCLSKGRRRATLLDNLIKTTTSY